MRAVSLFAGIGGFDLAMARAGITTTATAEIDKAARGILARHFPEAYHYDDVRSINHDAIGVRGPDIVTAGWPCQGNSVAGLRKGMADPRSGLWSECARVVGELRPRWFIGENVPGLLTVNGGRDFWHVVRTLDDLGYGVAWRVLDAQGFGVPQRRRRVIVAGYLGDPRRAVEILFEPESSGGSAEASDVARREAARSAASGAGIYSRNQSGEWRPGVKTLSGSDLQSAHRVVVGTLQGGGSRGYRIGAEDARDGHLVPVYVPEVAQTLTAGVSASPGVNPPGRRQEDDHNLIAVAVHGDVTQTLSASAARQPSEDGTGRGLPIVAFAEYGYAKWREDNKAGPLRHRDYKDGPAVLVGSRLAVRRLMPVECERLQGFPDGWTEGQSDAARYRQLGNAVAVPVIEWVMRRVVACEQQAREDAIAA